MFRKFIWLTAVIGLVLLAACADAPPAGRSAGAQDPDAVSVSATDMTADVMTGYTPEGFLYFGAAGAPSRSMRSSMPIARAAPVTMP